MLRSLRVRLLVAMVSIAIAAVAATAWLTSQGTADSVRGDVERELETDGMIYDQLWQYAESHPDWDGVGELVRELADRTGRRIALTTERGQPIVDSASLEGRNAPLPRRPAAIVDPFEPVVTYGGGILMDLDAAPVIEPSPFDLTDAELEERRTIAEAALPCMAAAGQEAEVVVDRDLKYVDLEPTSGDFSDAFYDAYDSCIDSAALSAPSRAEMERSNEEQQYAVDCMADAGIAASISTDPDGYAVVGYDDQDEQAVAAYDRCSIEAFHVVNDPYVAERALLYLGERHDNPTPWQSAGRGRTVAAAVVVGLLTVALSVLVSRRLLRPVAALTGAAQRMSRGDLGERVDERGRDELAGLAHAFNAMADAVESNEEQRRRLVTDIAHELRTPLANIRGYVEAAQDGVAPPDPELLDSVHEEAMLLQHLIDDLQTLALAEADRLSFDRQPVDVGELVDQVGTAYRVLAGSEGVELVVDPPDPAGALVVEADPVRLRQALGNLVANAVRYTPDGGRVTIRVRSDGDDVVVGVADAGVGIAPEDLPHVFDRFWRADASRTRGTGGSGLGLAITSQLVERQGGTVTATSIRGEGSTFTVRLPRRS